MKPFIDLPHLTLPFDHTEIFTDQDYEIANSKEQLIQNTQTENILWEGVEESLLRTNSRDTRPSSTMGYITSKKFQYILKDFFNDNFKINIMDDIWTPSIGVKFLPITLIKFHKSSVWHREGNADFYNRDVINMLDGRVNYAVNFPLYGDPNNSEVWFGKPSEKLIREEMDLLYKLSNTEDKVTGVTNIEKTLRVSSSIDSILDENVWGEHIEITGIKKGYHCPYIINLSSYHKVLTDNTNRISLRFMGNSSKYTYKDIVQLFENNELF